LFVLLVVSAASKLNVPSISSSRHYIKQRQKQRFQTYSRFSSNRTTGCTKQTADPDKAAENQCFEVFATKSSFLLLQVKGDSIKLKNNTCTQSRTIYGNQCIGNEAGCSQLQ